MNIFILDHDPIKAAQLHCNEHVLKMCVEYAQMLSSAHRFLDGKKYIDRGKNGRNIQRWRHSNTVLYKVTHINHPCTKWVRASQANYEFTYELWSELSKEFSRRFNKSHRSFNILGDFLSNAPKNIPKIRLTEFRQCMPEQYFRECAVEAYKAFYKFDKSRFATYLSKDPFRFYC